MSCGLEKLWFGIRNVCLCLVSSILIFLGSGAVAEAALLDGVMGGFEESMGKRAQAKGEQLIIGNFYPAERPDSHGPIGAMGEHTHNEGEFMFTYKYMRMFMEGNRDGTNNLSKSDVLRDFVITPTEMTTQMHMFGFMYGLNETVTLTAMIPYVLKSMDHVHRNGTKFTTKSSGFGDIRLGSLVRLYAFETPSIGSHRFHLNAAVGLPTGDIKATGATPLGPNTRLPYPMQLGSGTVDLFPGLTYGGNLDNASWGLQAVGTIRLGDNNQGYALGDEYEVSAYGAYRWIEWLSTSLRFKWKDWANYEGRDPNITQFVGMGPLVHTADPNHRAGERLDIFGGINILFPEFMELENHLGVEVGVPIYQNLDGPQLESDYTFFVGWQIIN